MKQRSKFALLQDIKAYEGMKRDKARGYNISGSVVFWRMSVSWYLILRDSFKFDDDDIQRILGIISQKDIYSMPKEKRNKIMTLMKNKGSDCVIENIASQRRYKNNVIAEQVRILENYNADISINFCLLLFDYLIRYQKFDADKLNVAIESISFYDCLPVRRIWEYREEIYDDTGFWIALDHETPDDAYHIGFDEFSINTLGIK